MTRTIILLAAVAILGYSGYQARSWVDREQQSAEVAVAAARLDNLPEQIGDWKGTDQELDPHEMMRAGVARGWLRRYVDQSTGSSVLILIVCGRPGPVCVHTPDVCYQGAGYDIVEATKLDVPGPAEDAASQRFIIGRFRKANTAIPQDLEIAWAWNGRGQWEAPEDPRLTFGVYPALYKIYLIREAGESTHRLNDPPQRVKEFLSEFLAQVNKKLMPEAARGAGTAASEDKVSGRTEAIPIRR